MNHDETLRLLGPYRDGELDLATCLRVEEHLAACPACRAALEEEKALGDLVASEAPRFAAPPFLKARLRAALPEEAPSPFPWWRRLSPAWRYSGLAGAVAVILFGFFVLPLGGMSELDREAVTDHVRSLQVSHLVDVASSDQHTVKPWFAGKLDYSPQIVDLGPSGYPVVGGRLDVLDRQAVAAVIYQRRKHYINLFIWPSEGGAIRGGLRSRNGYHVLRWTKSGMNYVAVSELGVKELKEFAGMIQEQTLDSRPGE